MEKDIQIKVVGHQTDPYGTTNEDKTTQEGQYYYRNNTHFVITEDEQNAQSARYKFNHRFLEVVKNGDINAKMYFETGKDYTSEYRTPFGRMTLTFKTIQLTLIEENDEIRVSALYSIYNGDNFISDNDINICLVSR